MRYQLADLVNGTFGEIYNTFEDASEALKAAIDEGNALNEAFAEETGKAPGDASKFFSIVEI